MISDEGPSSQDAQPEFPHSINLYNWDPSMATILNWISLFRTLHSTCCAENSRETCWTARFGKQLRSL